MTDHPGAPPADDFALGAKESRLSPVIRAEIEAAGGVITFARFMTLALGHPDHGYYSRADLAWGRDGDFETSPEVHPIFGYLWARQIENCWERLGRPATYDLVEVGAGSGAWSAAILAWLRERSPDCFAATRATLLDGNAHRLGDQRRTLEAGGLTAQHQLIEEWLAEPGPVTGVIISNEFFDALPIHLVERRDDELMEWHVTNEGSAFQFALRPASTAALDAYFDALELQPGDGARAEVNLAAPEVMGALASRIERGYLFAIDYGHEAKDLYVGWRRMGTLMAFRSHSPQPDPLSTPGLLDLTAHVDFTSLANALRASDFEVAPTVSQAEALTVLGLPEAMQAAESRGHEDVARYAEERRAAATLTNLEGLGRIRVLAASKGTPLEGLRSLRSITEAYG